MNPTTLMPTAASVVPIACLSKLGTSGLRVSRIGLGLASLGRPAYMAWGRDAAKDTLKTDRKLCEEIEATVKARLEEVGARNSETTRL